MAYGSLTLADLLATSDNASLLTSIIQFGEDRLFEAFDVDLAVHRLLLAEKLDLFVDTTTDRLRRYGVSDRIDLEPLDEFGSPGAQRVLPTGTTVGFPLRRFGAARQWTRDWFSRHRPRELAIQLQAAIDANTRRVDAEIRRALFTPTNYTFVDRLVDNVELPVKALVNADGAAIPPAPDGTTFNGATHTHYLARAGGSLANTDIQALIATVLEHYNTGEVMLYINRAQEAAIRAMTTNFTAFTDARIIQPVTAVRTAGALDILNPNNRAIGIFDEATVWVKSWIPSGYLFCYMRGAPVPLVMRTPDMGETGLHLVYDNELFPLRAQAVEHDFGIAVWNRTNGAILYNGSPYTAPSIVV